MNKTILITGATGFVGQSLVPAALHSGLMVRVATRNNHREWPYAVTPFTVGNIDTNTDWHNALTGCDCVIHLAGRAHVMNEHLADPLSEYRLVNTRATLAFATQAADCSVKRFIYVSSIKVNGEATVEGLPFTADSCPVPSDPYGISKWEAEQGLYEIAANTGMEVVVVRPSLIYGLGVKANFATLLKILKRGLPLPLACISDNRRSFVGVDNLNDFLLLCVNHPAAANQTFLISDGEDLSTAQLLSRLGEAIGCPARLFPVPKIILEWGAKLSGKSDKALRLLGNLQVDIQKNRELLNWEPPLSVDEGFRCLRTGETNNSL